MDVLNLQGTINNTDVNIKVSQAHGSGGGYPIYVNDYYQGTIQKLTDKWTAHLKGRSKLTSTNIHVLGDMIEEQRQLLNVRRTTDNE